MKKKFTGLLVGILIAGCAPSTSKNMLTIALPVEPPSITPHAHNDSYSNHLRRQIYENLIGEDHEGNLIPILASEWKSISPTIFQVTVRDGVLFHNGRTLTSEDVAFSVNRAATAPTTRSILSIIKNAEVVDDSTVNIHLHGPYAAIAKLLSHPGVHIISKSTIEEAGTNNSYIGTGPYQFVEWKYGDSITLSKHTNYWDTPAEIDTVIYRNIPDSSVRAIAVETGEVDVAYDISGSDRERFLKDSKVNFIEAPLTRQDYLGFNFGKQNNTVWTNKLLRQAIIHAIDYKGIVDSVLFGGANVASAILEPQVFGAKTNLPIRTRDLDKAKELFVQSGASTNIKATIYTLEGARKRVAEVLQANLRELGIEVAIQTFELGKYLEESWNGRLDLFIWGWTSIPADADIGIYPLLHSSSKGTGGNYTFYSSPDVDKLLETARADFDSNRRIQLYDQIQTIIYDEAPFIPLYYSYQNVAYSKKIKSFVLNKFTLHDAKYISWK
ncbi:MAG: ABC transporter substrate-binding protein [Brevinema sp.]